MPDISERLRSLDSVPAPDIWDRIPTWQIGEPQPTSRGRLRQSLVLALLIVLTAGIGTGIYFGVSSGSSPPLQSAEGPPTCRSDQLHLSSDRAGWHANQSAMNQFIETFTLTNNSSSACRLTGWPSLQALVAGVPREAHFTLVRQGTPGAAASKPVRLSPGDVASFDIFGESWDVVHNRACPASTSGFIVTLPGDSRKMPVEAPEPDCGNFYVAPLIPGGVDNAPWSGIIPPQEPAAT